MPRQRQPLLLVTGDGVAGTALAAALARRGAPVAVLSGAKRTAAPSQGWLPIARKRARTLPPGVMIEESLPVDILLAGEHRVETSARVALVDQRALRATYRDRARAAGVRFDGGSPASRPLRDRGGTIGVRETDGSTRRATLTVDATGSGALLGALPGSWLPGGTHGRANREPVLFARLDLPADRVQASWVGRAQLLLGLDGGLAWRCTPRAGGPVLVAVSAGPGAGASQTRDLLAGVVGRDGAAHAETTLRWLPCRRPLDALGANGLFACGSAAGLLDTLLGCHLRPLESTTDALARALPPPEAGHPSTADLFPASVAVQRCAGGWLARRQLERRWLQALSPAQRESMVVSGVLGPDAWASALAGGPLLAASTPLLARLGRLPRELRTDLRRLRGQLAAVGALYRRYPRTHDMFALDRWQERVEGLFTAGGQAGRT